MLFQRMMHVNRPLKMRGSRPEQEVIEETRCVLAMCENPDWNVKRILGNRRPAFPHRLRQISPRLVACPRRHPDRERPAQRIRTQLFLFHRLEECGRQITWNVEVMAGGDYQAVLYYTCAASDMGATVELSFEGQAVKARVAEAFDRPSSTPWTGYHEPNPT
jgi:hypothetical protein